VAPATANAFNVEEGSIVKAVHLEYWISSNESAGGTSQFVFIVEKEPGNGTAMTVAQSLNLGSYPNKKNVLFTSQGQFTSHNDGAQSVPVLRNWLLIPKGKQRMGLDDSIRVHFSAVGALRICGLATYKEYR